MSNHQINKEKDWAEFIIDDNCDFDRFYYAAEVLQKHFKVSFLNKLDDFDTLYWDFEVDNNAMTLHYNIYLGLSLFPTRLREADEVENLAVYQLGQVLKQLLTAAGNISA